MACSSLGLHDLPGRSDASQRRFTLTRYLLTIYTIDLAPIREVWYIEGVADEPTAQLEAR